MRTAPIIGSIIAASALLTLGLVTPAAAKRDKCLAVIATELHRAGNADLAAILKGKTPGTVLSSKKINKKCSTLSPGIGYTGCPGVAGCPKNTDTTVAGYQSCINCITKKAAASLPPATCGNGTVDPGEDCDGAVVTGCSAGQTCSRYCTCFNPVCGKLKFTFESGTTNCGGPGLSPGASAPFSGGLFDATSGGNKVQDLGLGCLYFGGGAATIVSPGPIPDGAATILDAVCDAANPGHLTLTGSTGTGLADCTKGPKTTRHCANDPSTACTLDSDCTVGGSKQCQLDPQCYFGPPLALPNPNNPPLSACVVNVLASDAAGTANASTGDITLSSYSLKSLVYLTGDATFSCPACVSGTCNGGDRIGLPCTATATSGVTLDCLPGAAFYLGALDVNLAPLTTAATQKSDVDGLFCNDPFCSTGAGSCDPNDPNACNGIGTCGGQPHPGAFGQATTKSITETGSAAGDMTDNQPHAATLAYVFCIPPPGQPATSSSDLPGPGAVSIKGTAQFIPTP